jgi:hypothetical protein
MNMIRVRVRAHVRVHVRVHVAAPAHIVGVPPTSWEYSHIYVGVPPTSWEYSHIYVGVPTSHIVGVLPYVCGNTRTVLEYMQLWK